MAENNSVHFKEITLSGYLKLREDNVIDDNTLYFVSNNISNSGVDSNLASPLLLFKGNSLIGNSGVLFRKCENGVLAVSTGTILDIETISDDDKYIKSITIKGSNLPVSYFPDRSTSNNIVLRFNQTKKYYYEYSDGTKSDLMPVSDGSGIYDISLDLYDIGRNNTGALYIAGHTNTPLSESFSYEDESRENIKIEFETAQETESGLLKDFKYINTIEKIEDETLDSKINTTDIITGKTILAKYEITKTTLTLEYTDMKIDNFLELSYQINSAIPGVPGQVLFLVNKDDIAGSHNTYMYTWDENQWVNTNLTYILGKSSQVSDVKVNGTSVVNKETKVANIDISTTIFEFKGSVDNYSKLPTSGISNGDTYYALTSVTILDITYKDGLYTYNGRSWSYIGDGFDLSNYYDKSTIDEKLSNFYNKSAIDEKFYGKHYEDESLCYFYVETISDNQQLDLRTIYNDTNIKNEISSTCFVSYDDETSIPIVNDDSLRHTFAEAGIHEVAVSGITGLTTNLLFRESTILKKAVIGNTLTTINHWLFNDVTMDDVIFLSVVPPTFSGTAGTSYMSMNNITTIRVPSQSLDAYRNSAMADSNKAKLAPINTGIVGEISDIKSEMISINTNITNTREDLGELTNRFNEYVIPHEDDKTYITITLTNSLSIDCRQLYMAGVENPISTLDWGDGNVIADVPTAYADNDDNLRHTYVQAGTYTLVLSGMIKWNNLWAKANTGIIDELELASTITAIQYSCFENLKKLVIKNPDLFTIVLYNGEVSSYKSIGSVNEIYVPEGTFMNFYDTDRYDTTFKNVLVEPDDNILYKDKTVTVGVNGDYATLSEAMRYLSTYYPTYKYGGIHAYIKILSGTTISEQILVDGADWSWMEIIYEDYSPSNLNYDTVAESIANGTIIFDITENYNAVSVDATNFTGVTHDTRGDVCLFRAENGGKLPIIGCVFKLVTQPSDNKPVAGMVCNRGSEGVIKTLCGFIGFNDGVISNNESSITIREGITMNCVRWGCHSRHNGEVSARSVIATGCGTVNSSESAALYSDRVADLDGREAYVSNSGVQIRCNNTSRMNCNGTHIIGSTNNIVEFVNTYVSTSNLSGMYIDDNLTTVKLTNKFGGNMVVSNYSFDSTYTFNTLSADGIIYK